MLRGIVQHDTLNVVNIRLSDGSKAFDYYGYTNIVLKVLKADGTSYIDSEGENVVATSPEDGIVTVILGGQATAAAGLNQAVIEIYADGDRMTSARLIYEVFEELPVDETALVSEVDYPVLQNLMLTMENGYVTRAEQAADEAEMWAKQAKVIAGGDYAPGGYGLGENCKTITDWNTALASGWYKTTVADANNHSPDGMAWYGYVTAYASYLVVQEAWHANTKNWANKCVRWLRDGVWSEWEYVNPPMQAGVEYRTSERFLAKPVYRKVVLAVIPENKASVVATVPSGGVLVDYDAMVQKRGDETTVRVFPFNSNAADTDRIDCWNENGSVYLKTYAEGWTAYQAYISLKYTKTTDT